ncbi:MAG: hypothetical protein ACPLXS_03555 [Candidatus Micrarchaeales archaeon]|jgi:hypothetical protein
MKGQVGLGKVLEAIRKAIRRIIVRKQRIYFYRVTYSGTVEVPPDLRRMDKEYRERTKIIWELTFEEPPFFRSFTDNERDFYKRYDRIIRDLIKEQELRMMAWKSPTGKIGALTWKEWVPVEEVPREYLEAYRKSALTEEEKIQLAKGYVHFPARPILLVKDVEIVKTSSFYKGERVDFIEVPAGKYTKAKDRYTFTVYRPPYTMDEQICSWTDEFTHDL